ncbi:MAG: DNA photolyase [Eubacteriales bacterium]|nr:DNA photolyase [Eubacteriales bacterium]
MSHSNTNGQNKGRFSAIYVEQTAFDYPLTTFILDQYPECSVISISHYKDLFNRSKQNQRFQKENPALILAVKSEPLLYPGPPICQSFGHTRFKLAHLMINCPYDCTYCFLQGLYPSAYQIAYVNLEDFLLAMQQETASGPYYLALSHDADLLASHAVVPYLDRLIPWLNQQKEITAEVRTKAAVSDLFRNHAPVPNLIFAFTLAPERIIQQYENKTPSLNARLSAIQTAINYGHAVRLIFDPVFADETFRDDYLSFFETVFTHIKPHQVLDVSYGFFRMPDTLYRRIAKKRTDSPLFVNPLPCEQKNRSYPLETREAWTHDHLSILTRFLPREKIFLI